MYYVIRDNFPNGQIQIFSQQAYDNEQQFINKIIDQCDSLEEAKVLKQNLVDSEVNGYVGKDMM